MENESEYNQKIGELQDKTLECRELAGEIYIMLKDFKDCDNHHAVMSRGIVEEIIEHCRKAAQMVGWIDTRVFDKDEYFEEYCYVCGKVKDKCHDDVSTSYDNPGFICFECESARQVEEDRYKYADSLME